MISTIANGPNARRRMAPGRNDHVTGQAGESPGTARCNWFPLVITTGLLALGVMVFWLWWKIVETVMWAVFHYEFPVLAYWAAVLVYVVAAAVHLTIRSRRRARESLQKLDQQPMKDGELHAALVEWHTRGRRALDVTKALAALVFLPTWLLFAPVLLPVAGVAALLRLQGEMRFRACMRRQGRYMAWQDVTRRVEAGEGTLIVARSQKGPDLWWTNEDVTTVSPHPVPHDLEDVSWDCPDEDRPFTAWCQERYLHPNHGIAHYTVLPRRARRRWWQALPQGRVVHVRGWMVPPRTIPLVD